MRCLAALFAGVVLASSLAAQDFLGKPLSAWTAELSSPQTDVRRSAAFALGKLGDKAFSAIADLTQALGDREARVREAAAFALGDIAAARRNAPTVFSNAGGKLGELVESDPNAKVRRSAAYALGNCGPVASAARSKLAEVLRKDREAIVKQNAAWALGRIGGEKPFTSVRALTEALKNEQDDLVLRDAAAALGEIGAPDAQVGVQDLIGVLKRNGNPDVHKSALEALNGLVSPEDAKHAGAVSPFLNDKDPDIAQAAAFVLASMGEAGRAALPHLVKALQKGDPQTQGLAAAALASLGKEAQPAVLELTRIMRDRKLPAATRRNAALALTRIGENAADAVRDLAEVLKPEEPTEVRQFAAEALARIGHPATSSVANELLGAIEKDPDPTVRQRATWALFTFPDLNAINAVPVLIKSLQDKRRESTMVRYDTARILARRLGGNAPPETLDVLLDMLRDTNIRVYNQTDAKVKTGGEPGAGQATTKTNIGGDARFMACEAIEKMGRKANRPDVIAALEEAQKAEDGRVRETATKALEAIK
jgi:HEAT repeat protein